MVSHICYASCFVLGTTKLGISTLYLSILLLMTEKLTIDIIFGDIYLNIILVLTCDANLYPFCQKVHKNRKRDI